MVRTKKNILVLSSYPANYRVAVFEELSKKYNLTILFNTNKNENRNPDWFVKSKNNFFYIVKTPEGEKKLKECSKNLKKFDLVLAYDSSMNWALRLLLKARMFGIPYILNSDGAFPGKRKFPKEQIKRFFYSGAKAWVVSGEYAKQNFVHYGADESRVFIHNFTSLHKADILSAPVTFEEKERIRKEIGFEGEKIVLSIGQYIERKGFDIILKAWKECQDCGYKLVIIGGGDLKPQYEEYIRSNNIQNVVLIDFVPFNEVKKYYMAAEIFVLPTREDIWGLVVNEAMSFGIPVMTSDRCIAGLELIENGKNGFIIENNDVSKWSESLIKLMNDDKLRYDMAVNNIEKISGWTLEGIAEIDSKAIDLVIEG